MAVAGSPMRPAELRSGDTCQAMSLVVMRLPRRSLRLKTWRSPLRSEARRRPSPVAHDDPVLVDQRHEVGERSQGHEVHAREGRGRRASSRARTRDTNVSTSVSISVSGREE